MQIFKNENKQEAEKLLEYYRNEVFDGEILSLLEKQDFQNLVDVANYADIGVWTAIEAEFCLGFNAGKGGAV